VDLLVWLFCPRNFKVKVTLRGQKSLFMSSVSLWWHLCPLYTSFYARDGCCFPLTGVCVSMLQESSPTPSVSSVVRRGTCPASVQTTLEASTPTAAAVTSVDQWNTCVGTAHSTSRNRVCTRVLVNIIRLISPKYLPDV